MKSAVETLGPTRIKLTVEVPFAELEPAVAAAYRKVGQQVRVKGFRPGKVPPRIVDQYVGRGAVLDEAVNEAVPMLYGEAIREQEVDILGHPEIEVTQFTDGEELVFTAEVDVRPEIELPTTTACRSRSTTPSSPTRRSPSSCRACATASPRSPASSGRPHPATTSRSTCPRRSTASRSRTPAPTTCPTRSAATHSSTASTTRSSGCR